VGSLHSARPDYAALGQAFGARVPDDSSVSGAEVIHDNPLYDYFASYTEGPGIWKPVQYFGPYHRHLGRYVGRPVTVLEIGVYSGGSLRMWRDYFGSQAHVYGVDIEPECRQHTDERIDVVIGDQSDPAFWAESLAALPELDVVIDDGGHEPQHQIPTFEAVLGHIRRGGTYICEDLGGVDNGFWQYLSGVARNLNVVAPRTTGLQQTIGSVHLYPFMAVIEITETPFGEFSTRRQGSQWAQFA
jgi:hypothetical protein